MFLFFNSPESYDLKALSRMVNLKPLLKLPHRAIDLAFYGHARMKKCCLGQFVWNKIIYTILLFCSCVTGQKISYPATDNTEFLGKKKRVRSISMLQKTQESCNGTCVPYSFQ